MTNRPDPFDILAASNPANPGSIDPFSPSADRLLAAIFSTTSERRTGTMPRRRYLQIAIVVGALLAALGLTYYLTKRDVTALGITCYATVSLDGHRAEQPGTGALDPNECAQPFEDGTLQVPNEPAGTVPPLTACVTDLGGLAVFPTDDPNVCKKLGLAEPPPDQPTSQLQAASAAREEIKEYVTSTKCQPIQDAPPVIREILDRHGLNDWNIERSPDQPNQPCTSIAFRTERRTIILIPIEPNPDM